jgi:hypothetical protein
VKARLRMRRRVLRASLVAALACSASSATAGEVEAVRLSVDAPKKCVAHDDIVAQVEALGGHLRESVDERRVRELAVVVSRDHEELDVSLVVRDLVGRATQRRTKSPDCKHATKAASLLVALALDDAAEAAPAPRADAQLSPAFWPAPATIDTPTSGGHYETVVDRLGSGGLLVSGIAGMVMADAVDLTLGIRALGVARVVDTTRLGLGLSLVHENRTVIREHSTVRTGGWSGRLGAAVAWGAPWDDSVVGFAAEAGVAGGRQAGLSYSTTDTIYCSSYDGSHGCEHDPRRESDVFVSPFGSASLLFQVPLRKWRLRPIGGVGAVYVPLEPYRGTFSMEWTLGAVWQGW